VCVCVLRVVKGRDGAEGIMKEFPRRNWSLASVKRLLQQIDTTTSGWWQSSRDSTGTSTGLKPWRIFTLTHQGATRKRGRSLMSTIASIPEEAEKENEGGNR